MSAKAHVQTLRDLLLKSGVVDEFQLRSALAHLEQWGGRLPHALTELGMAEEDRLCEVIAGALGLAVYPLGTLQRDGLALGRLDAAFCEEHGVFPVSFNPRTHALVLAMADPTALDVVDLVAARAGARVQVVVAGEEQIKEAVNRHYRGQIPTPLPGPNLARRAVTADLGMGAPLELVHASAPPPARRPSANTLLDEMLEEVSPSVDAGEAGFSAQQLKQLEELRDRQGQATRILEAVRELLREKGLLR